MMKKYLFNIIAIILITQPLITYHVMGTAPFDSLSDSTYYFIYDCIQILGGILGVVVLWYYGYREMFRFHFKWSYLIWFPIIFVLNYLWYQFAVPYITSIHGDDSLISLGSSFSFLSIQVGSRYFFNAVFRSPIVEEILHRGLSFSLLSKYQKYHLDLLLSSAIFSMAHFWYDGWSNIDFLNYFVPGLLMGFYFKKTNCIYYIMGYHMFWNAFPYLMGWR